VDAIVNNATANFKVDPDPDSLHHAIYKAGGSGLRKEARAKARVKVGQVELTHGHDLPSSWVIHAAAPGYTGRKGVGQFNVLSACYRSAMRMAANHEFKTIAFPCLGTGGCMFPSRVAARIALQEIREYLDAHPEHRPERIIFCVRAAVDEKAYTDFLPVFFPPTHGDLDRARTSDWSATRAALAAQVLDARTQLQNALTAISDTYDFGTQSTVCAHDMHRINSTLASIRNYLLGSGELKQSLSDLNLLCSVILTACADIMEMAERAQKQGLTREAQFIWTEANANIRAKHGFDLTSVFDYSWIFANSLADALLLDMSEPDAMGRARHILETYGAQQKGHDVEDIRDPIDKAPEVHDSERPAAKIRGLVQVHQIPSVARLYILGHLEAKTTMAKPSTQFNHTVCLLREDITRLEVDIVVNSTDASFSGMGTLDRSIFKKGGEQLRSQVKAFGRCEEGDVKATPGYLLPAKHILHVVPPGQFRKDTKNVLRNIYRAILHDAVLMKATSIAIPSIGTGTLNYPRRDCVSLAIEEVKRFLESAEPGNGLDKIIFVVLPSNDEFIYKSLLPVYFPPTKGNTSPTMLAKQPTKTEESSSPPLPAPANSSPSGSEEKTPRGVRFGKQPVKSRPYNDQEAGALMDFDLHVDVCRICDNGLYERTHKLCKPGYLLAQTVLRRMEMSEDANVYSKADTKNQREQLEIPMEQLPSSMLLLSTIAKGAENTLGGTFIEVDEPDTTQPNDQVQEDDNVAQSPVAEDADIVEQATEQPAVVRVEVRVSSPDWVYSWIRVFKSKIEVYFGDYDPDPYGGSTGDPPDLSIDLTDTVAELTRNDPWTLSLLATPRRRELGIEWQFRNSEAADSIALFGLLKRAINRSRQGQGKSLLAEIGGATSSESIIPPVAQPENTGEALDTLSGSERDQLIRKYYRLRKTGWYDATGMQEIIDTVSQIIQTTDPDDRMAEEDLLKQLRQRQSEITAYDIQNQVDNKRHSGEDTDPQYVAHADTTSIPGDGPKDPSLETQILAYLDDDFKNRPGSYIGQKLEEIASALGLGPRFISWSLERLAAEGKVHKTIDDDTWVISQPGTELSSSERENKPAKLGFAETKALANRILIKMLVAQHPPSIPDLTFTLQTSTSTFWSAIRYLVAMKFIGSVSEGQRWTLTTAGRLRARGLQKISAEAGQEASRDTESVTSDEDPSNNLSGRALSYLRSLPGMSENVWDFATTLDTSVAELQPVLEQLGSEGLVENTEDRFIWKATPSSDCVPGNPRSMSTDVAPHSPILAESASATVKDTKAYDDTSTPHTQPTDSGSSIMDAAIASGQIQISEFFNYDNRRWNHATSHRTQINSSFVDERVLAQAAFRPDEQAGVYFVERKVQPEEVEEWIRQTRELQEEDTKIEREGHGKHTSSVSQSHPGGSTRAEPTLPTATDPQVDTPASKQEEQDHPTKPPEDPAATPPTASSKASSWRDGRGAKERRQTKSSRVLTDEIEEDMESGTASSLRQSKIARERKYKKASRAHTDDIDSELESYDGQEEDYV
jgi:O-acetyl-ADP-ribose deacetylase (regulator of RNase III)